MKEILFHLSYHISHVDLLQTQECLAPGTGLSLINNVVGENEGAKYRNVF